MENTNKKRYWLRGGVVGAISALIYSVYIFQEPCWSVDLAEGGGVCESSLIVNTIIILVSSIGYSLISFPVGAMLGWIYGKIKNRKSATLPSNV